MNSINSNPNLNFTARMDVSKVEQDKARWEKIAQNLENETAKYIPNGKISIRPGSSEGSLGITLQSTTKPNTGTYLDVYLDQDDSEKLLDLPNFRIVDALKKLFKINKQNDNILKAYDKFCDAIGEDALGNIESNLSTIAYGAISENIEKTALANKIIQDWDMSWGFNSD